MALLEYGFNDFKLVKLAKKGEPSGTAELADGRRVPLLAGGDLAVVVRADEVGKLQKSYDLKALEAPLAKHQHAGWLLAELEGVELGRTSLLVQEKVPRQFRFWKKIFPASRKK